MKNEIELKWTAVVFRKVTTQATNNQIYIELQKMQARWVIVVLSNGEHRAQQDKNIKNMSIYNTPKHMFTPLLFSNMFLILLNMFSDVANLISSNKFRWVKSKSISICRYKRHQCDAIK